MKYVLIESILIVILIMISIFSIQFTYLDPYNGIFTEINHSNYTSQTIYLKGIEYPVKIYIDSNGIAHIYAKDNKDLFLAEGYYMAQNRLFQMEIEALLASGNLSKWIKSEYRSDIAMHYLGLPENAYNLMIAYKENEKTYYDYLLSFSQGVNDFINQSQLSFEFKILNVKPFYWSPFDTIVWEEYMTLFLTTGIYEPIEMDLFYSYFGYNNTMSVWPFYPYYTQNITIVPGDGTINGYNLTDQGINTTYFWHLNWFSEWATGIDPNIIKNLTYLLRISYENISDPFIEYSHFGVGSNSWIITSNYSSYGYPMIANDPHLNLILPSLWIPLQLVDPNMNVTGWALAGIPGILIGHTKNTSWGITSAEGNSANDYLEILNGDYYLYNNTWHKLVEYNFTVLNKKYTLYYTNHGPIIGRYKNFGISVDWTASKISYIFIAELKLDMSNNYTDMVNALRYWGYPPQNFALISLHHAGYVTAGYYPLIKEVLPNNKTVYVIGSRSLLNGSDPRYSYCGYVPFKYLPQVMDPERGFAFAPNQPPVGMNYPYPFIGGFWASGGRALSIYNYLKNHDEINLTDMEELQSNLTDSWAEMLKPILIKYISNMTMNETEKEAFKILENWNCSADINSIGMTIYWYYVSNIYNNTFFYYEKLYNISFLYPPFETSLIYLLKNYPSSFWFDNNSTKILQISFKETISELINNLGNNFYNWYWGKVHKLLISSITGLLALSYGPIPFYGDDHTVSVGPTEFIIKFPLPYVTLSSSLRKIDIPGLNIYLGIFPGGPSENFLSYYYMNQMNLWYNHEYVNYGYGWKEEVIYNYEP
ncbi:MAG: penicillin acylase family protein [Thermoplasmata archaeon]